MTAAVKERLIEYSGDVPRQFTFGVEAGEKIFKGTMVALDANGHAMPAGVSGALDVVGVAMHDVDNTGGADSAKVVRVQTGVHTFANSAAAEEILEADLPCVAFAVDDQTVAVTNDGDQYPAGIAIARDGTTGVKVWISPLAAMLAKGQNSGARGVATLVAGAVTVTCPNVRADSTILVTPKGISGSTDFSYLDVDTITAGTSFTIEAKTVAHAADADAVGPVFYVVLN